MKNMVLIKNNGILTMDPDKNAAVEELKTKNIQHLCSKDCACAYASKCQKFADIANKDINKYDFITDGYQVIDENGETEQFVVEKCDNYKYQEPRKYSKQEKEEIKKLRESLMSFYFDAEDVNEAKIIQYDLHKRGYIKEASGSVVTDRQYAYLKTLKKPRNK